MILVLSSYLYLSFLMVFVPPIDRSAVSAPIAAIIGIAIIAGTIIAGTRRP
jgi:hypothetical protein